MSSTTKDIEQRSERKELPEGWRWVKLGEVCATTSGGTPSRGNKEFFCGNIPWIKSGELRDGFIHNAEESITEEGLCASSAKIMPRGTLLIAMYGATVGRLGINQIDAATNQAVCGIMPNTDIETDFLFLYLLMIRDVLINKSFGGAQPNISQTVIQNLSIPLPPLPEQQRIAAILKEQMGAVEKGRKAAQERLRAIKALPAAFLRQIFPDPGQPLPEGWRWAKLGDVCDIKGGKRLPAGTDFVDDYSPFPYIRVVDLKNGTVDTNNLKYLDEATQSLISRYIIGKDDIYISIAGTIGIIGMIPECLDGANLTENAAKLVVQDKKNVFRDFLALFLTSPLGKDFICERTNIVGQPKLALTRIATIPILLPPFSEQKCIAELFNKQMAMVEKARIAAEAELKAINTLPAALLRRAFNGEL